MYVKYKKGILLLIVFLCGGSIFTQSQQQTGVSAPPYTLYKQGKYRQAIERANELILQDPQNISAYAVQGWSYLSLRKWGDALKVATTAYKLNRNDRRIIQIMGEANYELGNYDVAMQYFNRYLTVAPNGQLAGWVYYFLGKIYQNQEKFYKADLSFNLAIDEEKKASRVPRVSWLFELARVQEVQKEIDKAIETYRQILAIDKNNTQAKQSLSRLTT